MANREDRMKAIEILTKTGKITDEHADDMKVAIGDLEGERQLDKVLATNLMMLILDVLEAKGVEKLLLSPRAFNQKFDFIHSFLGNDFSMRPSDLSQRPDYAQTNYYSLNGGRLYARRTIRWDDHVPGVGVGFESFFAENRARLNEHLQFGGWEIFFVTREEIEMMTS